MLIFECSSYWSKIFALTLFPVLLPSRFIALNKCKVTSIRKLDLLEGSKGLTFEPLIKDQSQVQRQLYWNL